MSEYHRDSDNNNNSDNENENENENIHVDDNIKSAPIYDPKEPFYIYKRKLDNFIFEVERKKLYNEILAIMNKLFGTKYTELSKFVKINNIPKLPDNIIKKYNLNNDFSNDKNLNILLSKIKYSLITYDNINFKIKTN
jgi:hypothetical protein